MKIKSASAIALATALVAGTALSFSAPAEASSVFSSPTASDQNWTGSLGLDFTVNRPIVVDALGAYFDGTGSADITVEIFTSTGTLVSGLSAIIPTTSSPYTFQSVTPVTLAAGNYQLTAWGYGPVGNYNTYGSGGTQIGFDTLGGALSLGLPYYNDPGNTGFANDHLDNFNGDGLHYYGAGNFDAFATPLPSTWTMMIAGFLGLGFLACRGSKGSSAAAVA